MQTVVSSEGGTIGYVMHGFNKQSRGSKGRELETKSIICQQLINFEEKEETKPVALAINRETQREVFRISFSTRYRNILDATTQLLLLPPSFSSSALVGQTFDQSCQLDV